MRPDDEIPILAQAASGFSQIRTTAGVVKTLQDHLARHGFSDLLITGLPVPQDRHWHREILCDGWRKEWYRRYIDEGHFEHDPCVARCRHGAFPFLWSELRSDHMSPRARQVMNEARDFSMNDGLCVPIHIPFRGPTVVTAAGDKIEMPPALRPLIEALCVKAFQAICRIEGLLDQAGGPILQRREAEVLQWTAAGKSAKEIGVILDVSRFTAEAHLRHIREKLDANNVSEAVTKALVLGEIQGGNDQIWRCDEDDD